MNSCNKTIIYDLDGTLADSFPVIASSYRHTLATLDRSNPSDEEIRLAIGPGLHKALEVLLQTEDRELIDRGVKIYRQYHDTIAYKETKLYPNVREMLAQVATLGSPQFIATMKAHGIVEPIVKHLELGDYFKEAIGSDPGGATKTKSQMINYLLAKYNLNSKDTILVGDTSHDARAAKESGVIFFAVSYGYGSLAELDSVGYDRIFHTVTELREVLEGSGISVRKCGVDE